MVAKCGKSPITGDWIYEITWKYAYFNICVFLIVDTTSLLKFVFPTAYYFCLDSRLGGCVVAIVAAIVAVVSIYLFNYFVFLFIYLFIYSFIYLFLFIYLFIYLYIYIFIYLFIYLFIDSVASTVVLVFVGGVVIAAVAFVVGVNVAFCVANSMLMFSVLILLCVQCFTVNSVDK